MPFLQTISGFISTSEILSEFFSANLAIFNIELTKASKSPLFFPLKPNNILLNFLHKKIDILVSTTVIEVGIDFPEANLIVIENSNKFGLSQLHQLRGRVGRGLKQGTCILLYKKNLSENAKKRIKILKSSNDGFFIAEEDMKLRGFGDVLGYQQSGSKDFKIADPIHHEDLFAIAEKYIKDKNINVNESKYTILLKYVFITNLQFTDQINFPNNRLQINCLQSVTYIILVLSANSNF